MRLHLFYPLFLLLVSGCSLVPTLTTEQVINQRATNRWNALITHNWKDAYQYETKGFRSSHTIKQFQSRFGHAVTWQAIDVLKVSVNETKTTATVSLKLSFITPMLGGGTQQSASMLTETWLLDNNEWWHYAK